MTQYVITKQNHVYYGGKGYSGPSCELAGIENGKVYDLFCEVIKDAEKLSKVNSIGWEINVYQPEKHYMTNI